MTGFPLKVKVISFPLLWPVVLNSGGLNSALVSLSSPVTTDSSSSPVTTDSSPALSLKLGEIPVSSIYGGGASPVLSVTKYSEVLYLLP